MLSHFLEINSIIRFPSKGNEIKRLLKSGFVPGIIYGKNVSENFIISIESKILLEISKDPSAKCRIYKLNLNHTFFFVILKDFVFNPLTDMPTHVDFKIVEEKDFISLDIPVKILNKDICIGVKRGGVLSLLSYWVKCKVSVSNIPTQISIDVQNFSMGKKFWSQDLNLENIKILKNFLLVKISGKSEEMLKPSAS